MQLNPGARRSSHRLQAPPIETKTRPARLPAGIRTTPAGAPRGARDSKTDVCVPGPHNRLVPGTVHWLRHGERLEELSKYSAKLNERMPPLLPFTPFLMERVLVRMISRTPPEQRASLMAEAIETMGGADHITPDHADALVLAFGTVEPDHPLLLEAAMRTFVQALGGRWITPTHAGMLVKALGRLQRLPTFEMLPAWQALAAGFGGAHMNDDALRALAGSIHWPRPGTGAAPGARPRGLTIDMIITQLVRLFAGPALTAQALDRLLDAIVPAAAPGHAPKAQALLAQQRAIQCLLENLRHQARPEREGKSWRVATWVPTGHLHAISLRLLQAQVGLKGQPLAAQDGPAAALVGFSHLPARVGDEDLPTLLAPGNRRTLVHLLLDFAVDRTQIAGLMRPAAGEAAARLDIGEQGALLQAVGQLVRAAGAAGLPLLQEVLAQLAPAMPALCPRRLAQIHGSLGNELIPPMGSSPMSPREPVEGYIAQLVCTLGPQQLTAAMAIWAPIQRLPGDPARLRLDALLAEGAGEAGAGALAALARAWLHGGAQDPVPPDDAMAMLASVRAARAPLSTGQYLGLLTGVVLGLRLAGRPPEQATALRQALALAGPETSMALRLAQDPLSPVTGEPLSLADREDLLELVLLDEVLGVDLGPGLAHPTLDAALARIATLQGPPGCPLPADEVARLRHRLALRMVQQAEEPRLDRTPGWRLLHGAWLDRLEQALDPARAVTETKHGGAPANARARGLDEGMAAADLMGFYESLDANFNLTRLHGQDLDAMPAGPLSLLANTPEDGDGWARVLDLVYELKEDIEARTTPATQDLWTAVRRRLARTEFLLIKLLARVQAHEQQAAAQAPPIPPED